MSTNRLSAYYQNTAFRFNHIVKHIYLMAYPAQTKGNPNDKDDKDGNHTNQEVMDERGKP